MPSADALLAERHTRPFLEKQRPVIDPFVSTTGNRSGRIVDLDMTAADFVVASTPLILLMFVLAWRGIPTLIAWRRERKYQAEWHRTFGAEQ